MVPSVQNANSVHAPLLSARHRSLLMAAVLAGMAAAATLVLILSLRGEHEPIRAAATVDSNASEKPSVFGTEASSPAPPDVQFSAPQIAESGGRAVVTVTGYDPNDQPATQGTGYVYSASGIIVTSYSAIRGASSVVVQTSSGAELNVIALMGYSVSRDLAVLAVLEGNLPALETGAGEIVQEGDAVFAMGPNNAVSEGAIGTRKAVGGVDLMEMTAQAADGSPVLNSHGKVIGLTTHQRVGGEFLTLATPSRYISDLLAERRVISFAQMREETR
jgi:S1-C subfamily serine protease